MSVDEIIRVLPMTIYQGNPFLLRSGSCQSDGPLSRTARTMSPHGTPCRTTIARIHLPTPPPNIKDMITAYRDRGKNTSADLRFESCFDTM